MLLLEPTHPLGEPESCHHHLLPWRGGPAVQEALGFRPGAVITLGSGARGLAWPLLSQALRKRPWVSFLLREMCAVLVPAAWLTASVKCSHGARFLANGKLS